MDDDFDLILTDHAQDQMEERGITSVDIMYVLKNGFVYDAAEAATRAGLYKYKINNPTPNSNRREVRLVVIPSPQRPQIKIATVMWADEPMTGG